MTTDERITQIKADIEFNGDPGYTADFAFLLAELDAARAREQVVADLLTDEREERQMADAELATLRAREAKLREALTMLAREALVVVGFAQAWTPLSAGDIADLRRAGEQARAALAEGEGTRG